MSSDVTNNLDIGALPPKYKAAQLLELLPAIEGAVRAGHSHVSICLDPTIVPGDLAEQTNDMVNAFRHRLDALSWRDASPSSCFHHSGGSRTTCWRDDYPIETLTGSHHQDCDTGTRILEQACLKIT